MSRTETSIVWNNHASFTVHAGETHLLVDPWFRGSTFDDGWDLLCETPNVDLDEITDVWISHEHPDHFHPPTLRSIPSESRRNMRFWYQRTRDRKVVHYASALGFRSVHECRSRQWNELSDDVLLRCEPWGLFDSVLVLQTAAGTIVNLNDCKTRDVHDARELRRKLRGIEIDVLVTQVEAGNDIDMLVEQVDALQPKFVVPGASFVWFSHEENHHHNACMTRIAKTAEDLGNNVDADVVVLYPGDRWVLGADHDNSSAFARYERDYERAEQAGFLHASESVSEERLMLDAAMWAARIQSVNGVRVLGALSGIGALDPAHIWVTDIGKAFTLSAQAGLKRSYQASEKCDAALSSSALAAMLRSPWGGNTIYVNGRVAFPEHGDHTRFRRWCSISSYNNHGYTITQMLPRLSLDVARRRALRLRKTSA
jgi:UDP-MurNAc hydroxylase